MQSGPLPAVSVVVPVRNGADGLESAVESALDQAYGGPLEVVIAVASSTDATAEVAAALTRDPRVRIVDNPSGGTASGLNAAIGAARGDLIVRCDAFATLPPGYIASAVATSTATGAANVGGVQASVGVTPVERAVAMAVRSPLGAGGVRYRVGGEPGPVDTVYLGVFRRAVLERLGGFDERFVRSQDAELNLRIVEAGETVWFDPTLEVQYRPRGSFGSLWRQYFGYGWWRRMVVRAHPGTLRLRQVVPVLFLLALVASFVALPIAPIFGAVLPVIYLAALFGFSLVQLIRTRDVAALLLPAVLVTIHIGWASGFVTAQVLRRSP